MSARRAVFGLLLSMALAVSSCQLFVDAKVKESTNPVCTVKGTITLADGTTPVAGAKVVVTYRTTYSVQSEATGKYTLAVPMKSFDNNEERATFYVYHQINNYYQTSIVLQKNTEVTQDVKLAGNEDLGAGKTIPGSIDTANGEKWFSFNAKYDQIFRVTLTMPQCSVEPFVEIFSEKPFDPVPQLHNEQTRMLWSGYKPDRNLDSGNRAISLGLPTDPASPYYIRVTDATRQNADKNVQFTMKVTVKDMPDDNELANNSTAGAMLLVPDQPDPTNPTISHYYDRNAYIAFVADKDWYKVNALTGKILRVIYSQPASDIAPHVFLYRVVHNPEYIDSWDTFQIDNNPAIWWHGTVAQSSAASFDSGNRGILNDAPGEYYVMIHDDQDVNYDDNTAYNLKYYVMDKRDADEPDNDSSSTTKTEVTSGVPWDGYVEYIGDNDYLKVGNVPTLSGNIMKADATFDFAATGTVIPQVTLYFGGSQIWQDSMSFPSKPTLTSGNRAVTSDTTGYVRIQNDNNQQGDYHKQYDYNNRYHVTVSVFPAPDKPFEPANNTRQDTVPVLTSGTGNPFCYIAAIGDHDWFRLPGVQKGEDVRLDVNYSGTHIIPHGELYRDGNNLWSQSASSAAPVTLHSLNRGFTAGGTCYVMVSDSTDSLYDETNPYTVTATLIHPGDFTYENAGNDTYGDATAALNTLSSGTAVTNRYISFIGDEDWYSIWNAPTGWKVDVSAIMSANSDGPLNITVELWNPTASSMFASVTTAANSGSSNTKTFTYNNNSSSYDYFLIRVHDSGNDHCSDTALYTLTATVSQQ